jgi:hypothetical protein
MSPVMSLDTVLLLTQLVDLKAQIMLVLSNKLLTQVMLSMSLKVGIR